MTIDQQKEYYKQQIIRNNARSITIRNYFTQRNIDTVLAYINAGGNPATDPEISKVYFALIGEFGEGFFGLENSPAVLLSKEDKSEI